MFCGNRISKSFPFRGSAIKRSLPLVGNPFALRFLFCGGFSLRSIKEKTQSLKRNRNGATRSTKLKVARSAGRVSGQSRLKVFDAKRRRENHLSTMSTKRRLAVRCGLRANARGSAPLPVRALLAEHLPKRSAEHTQATIKRDSIKRSVGVFCVY